MNLNDIVDGTLWIHQESGKVVHLEFLCKSKHETGEWVDSVGYICDDGKLYVRDVNTFIEKFVRK